MLHCQDCGHHHRRHDGHPHPCQGVIYNDSGGISRCPCQHHNQN